MRIVVGGYTHKSKKKLTILAIQWNGFEKQYFSSFLGRMHMSNVERKPEDLGVGARSGILIAELGEWIIQYPDNTFDIMSDGDFQSEWEPMPIPMIP